MDGTIVGADELTYRPAIWARGLAAAAAAACVAGCGWLLWRQGADPGFLGPGSTVIIWGAAGFSALFVWLAAWMAMAKVILFPDRIERRDLLRTQMISRDEIAGYRVDRPSRNYPVMRLYRAGDARKAFQFPIYGRDRAFDAWFAGKTDLDAADRAAETAALMADPAFGADPAQRAAAIAQWTKVSRGLTGAGIAVAAWTYLMPQPYLLAIAAAALAPAAAVALVPLTGGRLSLVPGKGGVRPSSAGLLIAGAGLLMRTLIDVDLLSWIGLLPLFTVLTGLAILAAWTADERVRNRSAVLLTLILAPAWAWSVAVQADVRLDTSPAQVFPTTVVDHHVSRGRHTSWVITLAPWGPRTGNQDVDVTSDYYDRTPVDSRVCVTLHNGALDAAWFVVADCGG